MPGGRKLAILEEILDRARKVAQEAEVFHMEHRDTPIHFEANRLKSVDTRETRGVALRLIKDGRLGFSSTTNLKDIQGLVASALEMAPFGAEAQFQFPESNDYPDVPVYDPEVERLDLEEMVHLGQSLIDRVRAHDSELLCDGGVSRSVATVTVANTRGGRARYTKSVFSIGVEGTIVRGTDMLFVMDSHSSCQPVRDTQRLERSLVEQLENTRTIAPVSTGELPVVFTPHGVAGALLGPLLAGLNGKTVLQGASPLGDRLGQQVVDTRFSLLDDPTRPYVPGSRMCDGEGVPSQRTPLIEAGHVRGFLYDLQTAAQAGKRSTGSASRSLGSLPSPGPSVLVVSEGPLSFQEMIADIEEGVVVERLLGAGQSNILGGDFSGNVLLGYKINRGRLVGRVKNTMVSGNVYRALENLMGVGREARWVGGGLWTPALSCVGISVATKR